MMTVRSALVFGCLLLSACVSMDNKCPFPGATQVGTCYYFLTITKNDGNVVRGQVADEVPVVNSKESGWFEGYEPAKEKYHFFEYPIPVDASLAARLQVGQSYWFLSEPGTDKLQYWAPDEKTLAKYKSTTQLK